MTTKVNFPKNSISKMTDITGNKTFIEAEENLKRLQAKIAPFSKKRRLTGKPPKEQWVDAYSLLI
ncbi:MAG: hypothetical protein L7F77_08805 [Candidatus Magnetominusculus sp. LBB02]|nr:hypothetical protein [Candidatus Magnetominusculus sp. LBB02]